jgi:hypothetical protein
MTMLDVPPGQARIAASYVAAIAILCAPAVWNGLPILYDDVGGYLERWPTHSLAPGRSVPYGLLLWITAPGFFVPMVLLQAATAVFVTDRALRVFGLQQSWWTLPGVTAAIAAISGAAFFASQAIPDAWAAPGVLALHLLAWHADLLRRAERFALAAIVAFAGAAHLAIFGVLAGLAMIYTLAWLGRRWWRIAPSALLLANVATIAGLALLLAANLLVAGRFALTPGGQIFWFGRLVESGIVGGVLAEDCPRADWKLCAYQAAMPKISDDLLWGVDSPLYRIGGWDDPGANREIASIIRRSLWTHPVDHIANAATLTARQFVTLATANNLAPIESWNLRHVLDTYTPWLIDRFDRSRQQQGTADLSAWSAWLVVPVSLAASFALPLVAGLRWRHGRRREAVLAAAVFLALLGNAFICGEFSGPSDRYQARLAWLAPLCLGLALMSRGRPQSPDRH